ncbi:MAG: type II toxin-antitoxin system VapC family toxin [Chloroflexi bacterium]|nr:type II toxin-antitoxin system VapC family toxin [Chloroflexota bacterium]
MTPSGSRPASTRRARRARDLSSTLRYLVDSDWLIDALADIPSARMVLEALSLEGLAVSIVAVGELYEGAAGFPDPDAQLAAYRAFLAPFPILGLTDPIVERFARERARLRRTGRLIPDLDLLIAATALHYDLALLTRNVRHFTPDRLPDIRLYRPSPDR